MGDKLDVLIVTPEEQGDISLEYKAYEWPLQSVVVSAASRTEVEDTFVTTFNERRSTNHTKDDFRFFGPIWVAAYLTDVSQENNPGWLAWCVAETRYEARGATVEEAKANFLTAWNANTSAREEAGTTGTTDLNVDWQEG